LQLTKISILFALLCTLLFNDSCVRNNPDNRYDRLSNNNQAWEDITDNTSSGGDQSGTRRRFSFLRSGVFGINCEPSDVSCVTGGNTTGTWDYITTTTVQVTIYNGPIYFYNIVKIDPTDLWLQDNNVRGKPVLRKFVPAR